jgi:hypothetical protein
LEELETILLAWFKQAHTANTSTNKPHLKEKALHVAAHLGTNGIQDLNGWINRCKKTHNLLYKTTPGESTIINPNGLEKQRTAQNNWQIPTKGHI